MKKFNLKQVFSNAKNKTKKSAGFTIMEIMIVLAIIGAGTVVALIAVPKAKEASAANAEVANINGIVSAVNDLYKSANSYEDLDTEVLIASGLAPSQLLQPGVTDEMFSGFGGSVSVDGANLPGSGANTTRLNSFKITYEDVPASMCVKLLTGVANNFAHVTVDGTTAVKQYSATGSENISPSDAATACGGGSAVSIEMYSK